MKDTQATHRIYIAPREGNGMAQTVEITKNFYDVDDSTGVHIDGSYWHPIVQASMGYVFKALWDSVPDGTMDTDIAINSLGARMRLIQNVWYVNAEDISIRAATILYPADRFNPTLLQLIAAVMAVVYIILLVFFHPPAGMTPVVAAAIGVLIVVDWWISRTGR